MLRRSFFLILLLLTAPAFAQEVTLTSPVVRAPEAKLRVDRFDVSRAAAQAVIEIGVYDDATPAVKIRYYNAIVPDSAHPTATLVGLWTAIRTARASEPAGVLASTNFRILGYLADNGYFPAHTLTP